MNEVLDTPSLDAGIRLNPADNVAVSVRRLDAGAEASGVTLRDAIPRGHKFALTAIAEGEPVLKYAQIIGYASQVIAPGAHVHLHNLEFRASRVDHAFCSTARETDFLAEADRATFQGYVRGDGRVGTRNYIAVITSVNCSATAGRLIAQHFTPRELAPYPNVDGVAAFVHGTGCAMAANSEGFANLQRVMWGYARNPNCAGVLMVGLGCESNQIDFLLDAYGIKRSPLFRTMNIQDMGGLRRTVEAGAKIVEEMLGAANALHRVTCDALNLTLALQCGGSDAWSGVTANPALGYAADLLVRNGGTAVLAETPEIYGAEHLLTSRARDVQTAEKLMQRIAWWEEYTQTHGGSMDNNPSPGNKEGGLTTILEKSLGAVAKSGTQRLEGVYRYAEPIDRKGFVFMDSPGYDPVSITGEIASGCNIAAFTTGRGSVFGSKPAPCIKIATNATMYHRMSDDMDVNAGRIIDQGATIEEVGREIFDLLLEVASGKQSLSEAQGLGDYEFVPWQIGAVM
ncbi:MAG TPA: altronate dehydratase family protein [Thermohalobaculum sp.]|nr:altronate dehydratase family protein [Thermohalobaculum sp.]